MTIVLARQVGIDLRRNEIEILWDGDLPTDVTGEQEATIDIGARGALLGIEFDSHWIQITDSPTSMEGPVRSASLTVRLEPQRVTIPRRGDGYAIAWPSGNQCWRQRAGSRTIETCAVVLDR